MIDFGIGAHGLVEGDDAALYLVRGSGEGERIVGVLAGDASGRWLVIVDDRGEVALLDLERSSRTALAPALATVHGALHPGARPSIAFDPSGRHLLYLRTIGGRLRPVVRDLDAGVERVVEPGPGELLAASWHDGGAWLRLELLRGDRNGDGRIQPPETILGTWVGTCGVGSTTSMHRPSPDAVVEHVAWRTDLRLHPRDGVAAPLGDALVVREGDAIVAVAPSGERRPLAIPPRCRPFFGDPRRDQVLAWCGEAGSVELIAFARDTRRPIARFADATIAALPPVASSRFVPLDLLDGEEPRWIDLDRRRLVDPRGRVVASHGTHAIVERDARLYLRDLASGRERPLGRARFYLDRPVLLGHGRLVAAGSSPSRSSLSVESSRSYMPAQTMAPRSPPISTPVASAPRSPTLPSAASTSSGATRARAQPARSPSPSRLLSDGDGAHDVQRRVLARRPAARSSDTDARSAPSERRRGPRPSPPLRATSYTHSRSSARLGPSRRPWSRMSRAGSRWCRRRP